MEAHDGRPSEESRAGCDIPAVSVVLRSKRCGKCKSEQPLTEFYLRKRPSGSILPDSYCKSCRRALAAVNQKAVSEYRKRRREAKKQAARSLPTKRCRDCEQDLPRSSFYDQEDMRDGKRMTCKECWNCRGRVEAFLARMAKARTKGLRPEA